MVQENSSGKALYNESEIVFLIPTPRIPPSETWPCIGSPFEIDLKVVESKPHVHEETIMAKDGSISIKETSTFMYRLISGMGKKVNAMEQFLVKPKDRALFHPDGYFELSEDTELAPKGTKFEIKSDYAVNDELGIYVHITRARKTPVFVFNQS